MSPVSPFLPDQVNESVEPLKGSGALAHDDDRNLKLSSLLSREIEPKDDMRSSDEQVNVRGLDLDPFADIVPSPSVNNVRIGGKFQPRAKAQPRKGTSRTVGIAISSNTMEEHAIVASTASASLQPGKCDNTGVNMMTDPADSSIISFEESVSKGLLRNEDHKISEVQSFADEKGSGLVDSSQSPVNDAQWLDVGREPHSGLGKSPEENTDNFSGLKGIHDCAAHCPNNREIPVPVSNDKKMEGGSKFPSQDSVMSSPLGACSAVIQNPVNCNEEIVQKDDEMLELEEAAACSDLGRLDNVPAPTILDCRSPTFQPESRVQSGKEILMEDAFDSVFPPQNCDIDISTFPLDDVPGDIEEEISKSRKRKSASASNPSQESGQVTLGGDRDGSGKSSKQLRKRSAALQLIDEPEDGARCNSDILSKPSCGSVVDGEDADYDYREDEDGAENAILETRSSEKPKKSAAAKGKAVRGRKRGSDVSEQSTQEPRKKFSHSTRRKKRLKELISMPEDEIDFQTLPVRDIILFAGYKERLAIKEAKASKNAETNQSKENSIYGEDSHNEEAEQDIGYTNDQSNVLFNHHSFMDRTPKARWSKQDTELFYEGIQQFGTDLSMITQLFPDLTRHQIKLKYKKEERQHPLRLATALSNRTKDHSHFEKVIEKLQQVAAQAEEESKRDAAVVGTDEEAELNPETNEETIKPEQDVNATAEDQEVGMDVVQSPSKYNEDDDDDDMDMWNSYESVF